MNLSILSGCRLFAGIPAARIPALLHSLGAYEKRFAKGQPIYRVGDIAHALCVVLSGSVTIERDDAWGNKSILDHIRPGAVFAEVYACVPDTPMMVSAVAAEPSEVLFLPASQLLAPAPHENKDHDTLLRSLHFLGRVEHALCGSIPIRPTPRLLFDRIIKKARGHNAATSYGFN